MLQPTPTATPQASVISVNVISAERAARTLHALFPHARIRVDSHANAVLVLASPDDIQQMRTVIQGIDIADPLAPKPEVVPLRILNPQDIIARLHRLYPNARIEPTSKQTLLIRAASRDLTEIKALIASLDVPLPTATPSSEPADAIKVVEANPRDVARALERQIPHLRASVAGSSVILVGSQDDIQKAKALTQAIDAAPFGSKYTEVYRLHNIDARSVATLISRSYPTVRISVDTDLNALSVYGTAAEQARIGAAISELDAAQPLPGSPTGAGGAAYGNQNIDVIDLDTAIPGQSGSPSTSATDIANAVQQALQGMAPDLHVTVPANTTEIILAGSPTSIHLAKDLITRLDRPQPLVVLDTEVLEVDENAARNIGISLPSAVIGSTFQEIQPTPDPSTGQPGRLIRLQPLTRTPIQFTAVLNLLVQNGNARVLADPRVTTISGHTASIRAGDTIGILTQSGGGVGTPVTQQIQTFNTGVTLDITPQVGPSGKITVALHPVVNSLEGILNGVPQIATRDTQTVVQLQDNQTLVIGGLIQETLQRNASKIPLLGDIPFVGKLFQDSNVQTQRNELVIVVTPHIIAPGADLPPPNAVSPIPTARPLPTLSPGTQLSSAVTLPSPRPEATPVFVTVPMGSLPPPDTPTPTFTSIPTPTVSSTPTSTPMPTPSAFANTNVFSFGSPPPNTYAADTDAPQLFFVQFLPTVLRNGTPVQVFAITSTNVTKVTIGYPGYVTTLTQISPSKWQANYNFNTSGLIVSQNAVNLAVSAYRRDGTAATIQIPVSILNR